MAASRPYVTEHYLGYDAVLVRLSRISTDLLRDLLRMAYTVVTAKVTHGSPSRQGRETRK